MNRDLRSSQAYGPALPAQFKELFSENHVTFFKINTWRYETNGDLQCALQLVAKKMSNVAVPASVESLAFRSVGDH